MGVKEELTLEEEESSQRKCVPGNGRESNLIF